MPSQLRGERQVLTRVSCEYLVVRREGDRSPRGRRIRQPDPSLVFVEVALGLRQLCCTCQGQCE